MFPGFNNKKRSSISSGDWDRDGKPNRGDCNAFDWRKQDDGEPFKDGLNLDSKTIRKMLEEEPNLTIAELKRRYDIK